MKKCLLVVLCFLTGPAIADQAALDAALRNTYNACVGINDQLSELKKMAGINTAVTGVGTAAGAGALVVGLMRSSELFPKLKNINVDSGARFSTVNINPDPGFRPNLKASGSARSKKLGNWRTGLLGVNTATNVAGAVIAAQNRDIDGLQVLVNDCNAAVKKLNESVLVARTENIDVAEAQDIYAACQEFENIDLSKISGRATGAMVSSIVGASAGAVGTVVSANANRDENMDNESLDTASNILAGGATVASGVATVFNATQISAIRDVAEIVEKCEAALK